MQKVIQRFWKDFLSVYEYEKAWIYTPIFIVESFHFSTFIRDMSLLEKRNYILLTKDEIIHGSDIFPLKFLHMKNHAVCIQGENFLEKVKIHTKMLRLNIESEIRNKMIQLREDFLSYPKKPNFFLFILPVMQMLREGMLHLYEKPIPQNMLFLLQDVEKYFGWNIAVFRYMYEYSISKKKLSSRDMVTYMQHVHDYMSHIAKLVNDFTL